MRFRQDSFEISFPDTDTWKTHWNEEDYRAWLVDHATRFPDGVLHVIHDGTIIGQLEFSYPGDIAHVNLFYLKPTMRGLGLGFALQEHVTSTLRSKGCCAATLRVSPTNQSAVKFYTKHGWKNLGPDPKYPQVHVYRIEL
ncbi:GNAT family N-acetyltransferase [Marinimicrobium agarilyticum]|uniref:GNAT family N-acetyltransferase n=1 Tax=Marinimicrobium agarilyticum TaxID=306546 RepID=UPI0004878209